MISENLFCYSFTSCPIPHFYFWNYSLYFELFQKLFLIPILKMLILDSLLNDNPQLNPTWQQLVAKVFINCTLHYQYNNSMHDSLDKMHNINATNKIQN